jgi:aminobenzoyl-glutamate utilization protein B
MSRAPNDYSAIDKAVDELQPVIEELALELWDLAELSLREVESEKAVRGALDELGFRTTSTATAGVATAFISEWGSGAPVIGLLAEYDALPGLGNAAVPRQEPRADGRQSGHGCGHNLFGAGVVGAAAALKRVMAERGLPGTIRVYGCAAEETEGAKVYMARDGLFSDLDAALHWHPGDRAAAMNMRLIAVNGMRIEFFGRTAHAGASPWQGRSAVHAAELFAHGTNLMREHLQPTARVHYIFEHAGVAPNIVPDYARISMMVRDLERPAVEAMSAWVRQIAEGAALATQTTARVEVVSGTYDLLPNTPLAERMQAHLERLGTPEYSEEEQAFAREVQRNSGLAEAGMAGAVAPLPDGTGVLGASTDVGDVSYLTPTMGFGAPTVPVGVAMHTWAATASHGTSIGLKGAVYAARALAGMGLDLVTDAGLREAARADLERRTQGSTYLSPLPPERKHPLGTPPELLAAMDDRQ